jgi:hypothetical protein
MSRWFRFYDCALDDPKVQKLSDRLFKTWINILCIASKSGGSLPCASDIAFMMRLSDGETADRMSALVEAGLIDELEHGYEPHNWSKRQFKSDGSTERVKRFRASERNVSCPVSETVDETGPETETDTDTERLKIVANPIESAPRVAKRAKPKHEIAADAQPSTVDLAFAASAGMAVPVVRIEWPKFRDHHISHGNRMADWSAAWRKWCGNWQGFAPHSRAGPNRKKTMGDLVRAA